MTLGHGQENELCKMSNKRPYIDLILGRLQSLIHGNFRAAKMISFEARSVYFSITVF